MIILTLMLHSGFMLYHNSERMHLKISLVVFEKMAHRLKWPYDYWTTFLQHVLIGKALEVYNQLDVEESEKFENVKEAIFNAYEKVSEAYGQKSRSQRKIFSQTYVEFAHAK